MTIEFHCPNCRKLLKTADDKAGVLAKCPGCGEPVMVPGLTAETAQADASFETAPVAAEGQMAIDAGAPPEVPEAPGEMKPCPMCGAQIRAAATRCRFCGEDLAGAASADGTPTKIDAGQILGRTWAIFQREMGMCIGIVLLSGFLNVLGAIPAAILDFLRNQGAVGRDAAIPLIIAHAAFQLLSMVWGYFLSIGQSIALLKIARGEPTQISDLFAGGRFFWRAIGAGILFGAMYAIAFLFCIVPGIVVWLMFSPFKYALIDRDAGAIESLSIAYRITTGNLLALFVVGLAAVGLVILGLIACGVGMLFTVPLVMLLEAVSYLAMSGLPTADHRRPT